MDWRQMLLLPLFLSFAGIVSQVKTGKCSSCLPLYVAGHHRECTGTVICVDLFLGTQRRGAFGGFLEIIKNNQQIIQNQKELIIFVLIIIIIK